MIKDWRKHWGRWVKARTRFLGLRLSFVAGSAGTTPRNLSKWLSRNSMPAMRAESREALAKVLQIDSRELPYAHNEADPTVVGFIRVDPAAAKTADIIEPDAGSPDMAFEVGKEIADASVRNLLSQIASQLTGEPLHHLVKDALRIAEHYVERIYWGKLVLIKPGDKLLKGKSRRVKKPKSVDRSNRSSKMQ